MNQFCLGKTEGEDERSRETESFLLLCLLLATGTLGRWDRLQHQQVDYSQLVCEKCGPLLKTVLIEILKLKNARMKVIIVLPASSVRLVLSWSRAPCLDRLQMKTINPCRSPIIMCYFLNTLPPPPPVTQRILFQF